MHCEHVLSAAKHLETLKIIALPGIFFNPCKATYSNSLLGRVHAEHVYVY